MGAGCLRDGEGYAGWLAGGVGQPPMAGVEACWPKAHASLVLLDSPSFPNLKCRLQQGLEGPGSWLLAELDSTSDPDSLALAQPGLPPQGRSGSWAVPRKRGKARCFPQDTRCQAGAPGPGVALTLGMPILSPWLQCSLTLPRSHQWT